MNRFVEVNNMTKERLKGVLNLMIDVWAPSQSKTRALYWIAVAVTADPFKPSLVQKIKEITTNEERKIIEKYIKAKGNRRMPDTIIAQYAFMRAVQEYLITVENGSDVDTEK